MLIEKFVPSKRNKSRTFKWNLVFNYSFLGYNLIVGIFLVPLYLKYIPASLYGAWLASGNILAWIGIINPGFGEIIQQKVAFHYGQKDHDKVGEYIVSGSFFSLLLSLLVIVIGLGISHSIIGWLNVSHLDGSQIIRAFRITVWGTAFSLLSFSIVGVNQGLQSSLGYSLIYMVTNIAALIITIVLLFQGLELIALAIGACFRGVGHVLGQGAYLILRLFTDKISLRLNRATNRSFFSLMNYNFIGKLSYTAIGQVDAFLTSRYLGAALVPILKFSQAAPAMSKMVLVRPAVALTPALTQLQGEGQQHKVNKLIVRLIYFMIWGSSLAFFGFLLFNETFVNLWVGSQFFGGTLLNMLICLLLLLTIFKEAFARILLALGDIKKNNLITMAQAIIYIPLIFFMLPYGLEGIVAASLLSNLLPFFYYPLTLRRKIRLTKQQQLGLVKETGRALLVFFPLSIFFLYNDPGKNWLYFGLEAVGLSILSFALFAFLSLNFRREVSFLLAAVKRKWKV